jgi:hypothetical protein
MAGCQQRHEPHEASLALVQIIFDNVPERSNAISPTDFFAFCIGASVIRNWHLVNPYAFQSGNFGCDFYLKPKSIFAQSKLLYGFAKKYLVPDLNIRQIKVRAYV